MELVAGSIPDSINGPTDDNIAFLKGDPSSCTLASSVKFGAVGKEGFGLGVVCPRFLGDIGTAAYV
jgi:hypothetical protein